MKTERDGREPQSCPRCGEMCAYDGWDHVHTTGLGIGSCGPVPLCPWCNKPVTSYTQQHCWALHGKMPEEAGMDIRPKQEKFKGPYVVWSDDGGPWSWRCQIDDVEGHDLETMEQAQQACREHHRTEHPESFT